MNFGVHNIVTTVSSNSVLSPPSGNMYALKVLSTLRWTCSGIKDCDLLILPRVTRVQVEAGEGKLLLYETFSFFFRDNYYREARAP